MPTALSGHVWDATWIHMPTQSRGHGTQPEFLTLTRHWVKQPDAIVPAVKNGRRLRILCETARDHFSWPSAAAKVIGWTIVGPIRSAFPFSKKLTDEGGGLPTLGRRAA